MKNLCVTPILVLISCFVGFAPGSAAETAGSPISLRSRRQPGDVHHVLAHLEVAGETKYTADGKPQQEKMSVVCDVDYCEKTLEVATDADGIWRSIRDYQKTAAKVKVGGDEFAPTLRSQYRLIAVEAAERTVTMFSPNGNLTRDELDAIEIPADTLLLDRLLPDKPVAVGDRWSHSPELMAAMLGLDEVTKCTVESTLTEVAKTVARFEMTGRVEGEVYGLSTTIEITAKYRFVLQTGHIDWFGMVRKEQRQGGLVADGVDATSRLDVRIKRVEEPAVLADAALAKLALKPTAELTRLTYESPSGEWQFQHDRRWHIHQRPGLAEAVLRLVDRGVPAGQCNLASLPDRDPDKLVSLEDFQDDVRQALGKNFGEFIEAGESSNDAGYRIHRVVVHGKASDVAMRWIYYLVADPQGRRVALTFVAEQKLVERFADADKPLVQSLRFTKEKKADEKLQKQPKETAL